MRISVACFTDWGEALAHRLAELLVSDQVEVTRCGEGRKSVADWTADVFPASKGLIFVGAVGIAVRAIAPHIVSKTSDPAVVVVDDAARFAVPLLSGHIGGANNLARRVARLLDAVPVVTTATDARGVFAVDSWAMSLGWTIANPERIKMVSARLLAGQEVRVKSVFPIDGDLPPGLVPAGSEYDLLLDIRDNPRPEALHIIPHVLSVGIGCRKGTTEKAIARAVDSLCREFGVSTKAICLICSIDLKKDEPGLKAFCHNRGRRFRTFEARELAAVPGSFSASPFVQSVTGVDNVCERSAVAGSGGGRLVARKHSANGITVAMAMLPTRIPFGYGQQEDFDA